MELSDTLISPFWNFYFSNIFFFFSFFGCLFWIVSEILSQFYAIFSIYLQRTSTNRKRSIKRKDVEPSWKMKDIVQGFSKALSNFFWGLLAHVVSIRVVLGLISISDKFKIVILRELNINIYGLRQTFNFVTITANWLIEQNSN